MSRPRHRSRRRGANTNNAKVFDTNVGEYRLRGTAHQIVSKLEQLALEADTQIGAQMFEQAAEHYRKETGAPT